MQKTIDEVENFLNEMRKRLEESPDNLKILARFKTEDKTREFMERHNIKHKTVCEEILKLDITNYSYTDFDENSKWEHEEVWFFGQILMMPGVNCSDEIYIKIKLRDNVICMSFHPKEWDLIYPYN